MIRKLSAGEIEAAIAKIEYLGYAVIPGVLSKQATRHLLEKVETLFECANPLGKNSGITTN
jgi:hypothetical protein